MMPESNYFGHMGFVWWIGVIEDRQDPLKLGRCRVRIVGSHTDDKALIPTEELPWAHPMMPLTDSSMLMFKEGDYVLGFYLDGPHAQRPVFMGILPGMPDQKPPKEKGFSDPREKKDLTAAPRPPKELKFDGKPGEKITIVENEQADRYPLHLNEPTISRLTRNDEDAGGTPSLSELGKLAQNPAVKDFAKQGVSEALSSQGIPAPISDYLAGEIVDAASDKIASSTEDQGPGQKEPQTTIIDTKKSLTLKSIPTAAGGTFNEPDSPYGAKYPYNRVIESESGHVIEIDDTPTKERIHIYHRSGTSIEIGPDATYISRVNADRYDVILADHNIFVGGDCNLTVGRNINMKSGADMNIEVEKSVNIKAGLGINMQAGTSLAMQAQGPAVLQAGDSLSLFAAATAFLQGSSTQIQSGIPAPIPGKLLGELGDPIKLNSLIGVVSGAVKSEEEKKKEDENLLPLPDDIDMTQLGNIELDGRAGTKTDPEHPTDSYTAPVETPTNIPVPTAANTISNTVTSVLSTGDVMVRAMNRAKLQDPIQRAMIWGQTYHESGGFKFTIENTAQYTRKNLLTVFPKYFTEANVDQYVGDGGVKWPARAYGSRMGNSTEASGDGYTYRGRGFIQLTGKANYLKASRSFNQDFVNYPDVVRTPDLAADIAVWYFLKGGRATGYRGSYSDLIGVTRFVNGGTNGLADRAKWFETGKTKSEVTTYNAELI